MVGLRENAFEIKCRNCGHTDDAKKFIIAVDSAVEFDVHYRYVQLECPVCKQTDTIDKTISHV